ncbi:MAG: transcription-repair coupling factor [Planctomycetes bacterium]|nr:transcription-repair coupling factor [Planctomycetota bacterium]
MVERGGAALEMALPEPVDDAEHVERKLRTQPLVSVGGLWGSAQALLLASLARRSKGTWVVITSSDAEASALVEDLKICGVSSLEFPARESGKARFDGGDADSVRRRLAVAQALNGPAAGRPRLLVAALLALLQPLPKPEELAQSALELQVGQKTTPEHLLKRLVDAGYERQPLVEKAGEVSLRGDIFDLYPFASELPLRVEFLDDAIESLRSFDPLEQKSVDKLERVEVCLARDVGGVEDSSGISPALLLPHDCVFVELEPLRIEDRGHGLSIQSASHQKELGLLRQALQARRRLQLQSLPAKDLNLDTRSVQALCGGIRQAPELLREATQDGTRVVVLCRNEAERHRFEGVLAEAGGVEQVEARVGLVAKGFRWPALRLVVVDHHELVGIAGARRVAPARQIHRTRALQSFFDLKPGDYVVHAVHGLALYKGLSRMARGGGEEEHLHLIFADEVSLYVPATRIDLVQRYIGSGGAAPALDKIGGQSFRRRREKVERALFDLAADLLEVQAKRELKKRAAWCPEETLVKDMVGSFPYVDTADQAQADREISEDLSGERPMDRLLCGDVGFGKTEIAMRAAFRVAAAGGQVAVLVPTTVLAHQHYLSFRERLADFPLEIAVLSRTVTGKDEKHALARLAAGEVDVIVGTHRLLSKDVSFKNLGLIVIDEEQRFGVTHKEHFKSLRAMVDVLALSATPIPRTLHMSLAGVRDISALSIPPPGRQEIETKLVDRNDEAFVRDALLREKNRDGQVFFLHNRVETIALVAHKLRELAPECSFAVGHGQMPAKELERIMDSFSRGEVDVLVATTIVENGLDIPAAGTILIDEADHYGLSELHQLRGRVGRGQHKAHCFLLVDPLKPMKQIARDRLKALEEMHHLGAGFAISMKDLELRGAGNILGPQQSGHIAAIGYDLYCRLLKQTVERVRHGLGPDRATTEAELSAGVELELGLRAFLPETWIPAQETRLEVLRQLETIHSEESALEIESMLRDRFGRVPPEASALLKSFRLRARALGLGLTRISYRSDVYLLEFKDRVALEHALAGRKVDLRPIRTGLAHLVIPSSRRAPDSALAWLEELLRGGAPLPRA